MTKLNLTATQTKLLPEMTRRVFGLFAQANKQIYLVGGAIRNLVAGLPPTNCDFTTNATPEEIQTIVSIFEPFYDNPYGTVGFAFVAPNGQKEVYEITPFRTEAGYTDRRRPDKVSWGTNIESDLQRRDFTINAVIVGVENDQYYFLDKVDGLSDLERKILRTVGDPNMRFAEDALRMMRAVRFASQLGLTIDPPTLAGIKTNFALLAKISQERIRDELFKILASPSPAEGIALLIETNLITHVLPELLDTIGVAQTGHHTMTVDEHLLESLRQCPSNDPLVRLAVLLHDIGKPATRRLRCAKCKHKLNLEQVIYQGNNAKETQLKCPSCGHVSTEHEAATFYGHEVVGARIAKKVAERLRLSNKERDKLFILVRWHMFNYDPKMTDAAIRRFIRRVGKENINDMIMLRIADRKGGRAKTTSWRLQEMQKRIGEQLFEPMTISDMAVNGHDIMTELQLKPGPILGKILTRLFDEVLEDTNKNKREMLLERARQILPETKDQYSDKKR